MTTSVDSPRTPTIAVPKKPLPGTGTPAGGPIASGPAAPKPADVVSVRQTHGISDRGGKRTPDARRASGSGSGAGASTGAAGDTTATPTASPAADPISPGRALLGVALGTVVGIALAAILGVFIDGQPSQTALRLLGGALVGAVCGGVVAQLSEARAEK